MHLSVYKMIYYGMKDQWWDYNVVSLYKKQRWQRKVEYLVQLYSSSMWLKKLIMMSVIQ